MDIKKTEVWIPDFSKTDDRDNPRTKFFGNPLGREGEWPICSECDTPLMFVFQVNYGKFPKEVKEALGIENGIAQLYYCAVCHYGSKCWDAYEWGYYLHGRFLEGDDLVPIISPLTGNTGDLADDVREFGTFYLTAESNVLSNLEREEEVANSLGPKIGGNYHESSRFHCSKCNKKLKFILAFHNYDFWSEPGIWMFQCPDHPEYIDIITEMFSG